ncbi:hypothetical protein LINGRAHAP2_LOCUS23792, partial [Linum grandiflorum]
MMFLFLDVFQEQKTPVTRRKLLLRRKFK